MRILHAIHDFLPRHRAGSEIYAFELAREQRALGYEPHILCAEYDASQPHGSLVWRSYDDLPVTELINNWRFGEFAESYRSPRIDTQLEHVLRAVGPDVLHIHNLLNLSFSLPRLAAARGIPSVATLHDFTLLCPSGGQRVHQAERHVCIDIDTDRCARCFPQSHFHAQMAFAGIAGSTAGMRVAAALAAPVRRFFPALFESLSRGIAAHAPQRALLASDIESRLTAVSREVFDTVELFVAPSAALAADYERFGLPAEKIRVSDYGFPALEATPRRRPHDTRRLRIGFVGTLVWHKGAHIVVDAVRQLPHDRFELAIYGSLDTFPAYVAELREKASGLPVEFRGGFDRGRVADVYADIDVLVVASLWPENSPLVIHEAFQAGVPVVGARMGGIANLVEHEVGGLLYDAFSPDDLARQLRRLVDAPEDVARFAGQLPAVKTIAQDAQEWDARYRDVLGSRNDG